MWTRHGRRLPFAHAAAVVAGVLRRRDHLQRLAHRDVDLPRRYGLGLYDPGDPYAEVVGHTGEDAGYPSWAGCLREEGSVVVVLTNPCSRTSAG